MLTTDGRTTGGRRTDGHRYDNTPSDDRGRRGGKMKLYFSESLVPLLTNEIYFIMIDINSKKIIEERNFKC